MKDEKTDDEFILFDDDVIEMLNEFQETGPEIESDDSGFDDNNEIPYDGTKGGDQESEQNIANDSLTNEHLPEVLLNIVLDISRRDCISEQLVALALFTMISSVFSEKLQICQKRNDPSAISATVISPLVITDARNARRINFKRTLRTLLQSHNYVNLDSQNESFDFQSLVVDSRRIFSGSKIKLVKGCETGRIEAIFSGDSFERKGNTVNPETQTFFISMDETELQSIVKNIDNASFLNQTILLSPSAVIWQSNDFPIDVDSVGAVSQVLARISSTINKLEDGDNLTLHFSPEAQEFYLGFVDELKRYLNQSTEHPSLIAHLDGFDELFCKIALVLYLCECAAAGTPITRECEIDLVAAERARAWCAILETHAQSVFQNLLSKNSVENLILQKIDEGRLGDTFTAREITRAQWTNLRSSSEVKKALSGLVEDGKIRIVTEGGSGGRPTLRYEAVDIDEVEDDLFDR